MRISIFAIFAIVSSLLFFGGCSKKETVPPNPVVQIPVGCSFAPIPPLKMMVINPKDDVEIDLRIQQQSDLMKETLKSCKRPS